MRPAAGRRARRANKALSRPFEAAQALFLCDMLPVVTRPVAHRRRPRQLAPGAHQRISSETSSSYRRPHHPQQQQQQRLPRLAAPAGGGRARVRGSGSDHARDPSAHVSPLWRAQAGSVHRGLAARKHPLPPTRPWTAHLARSACAQAIGPGLGAPPASAQERAVRRLPASHHQRQRRAARLRRGVCWAAAAQARRRRGAHPALRTASAVRRVVVLAGAGAARTAAAPLLARRAPVEQEDDDDDNGSGAGERDHAPRRPAPGAVAEQQLARDDLAAAMPLPRSAAPEAGARTDAGVSCVRILLLLLLLLLGGQGLRQAAAGRAGRQALDGQGQGLQAPDAAQEGPRGRGAHDVAGLERARA
eukprot:scaffold98_cov307-Prasinococcus_capsulatus_cf.AAC.5